MTTTISAPASLREAPAIPPDIPPHPGNAIQLREWVGHPWYPILKHLDHKIEELAPGYEISKIKERFGGLRYSIRTAGLLLPGVYEKIDRLIGDAENECAERGATR